MRQEAWLKRKESNRVNDDGNFDTQQKALLTNICNEHDVPFELVAKLLEIETAARIALGAMASSSPKRHSSALEPLKSQVFRAFWIAAIMTNTGLFMRRIW